MLCANSRTDHSRPYTYTRVELLYCMIHYLPLPASCFKANSATISKFPLGLVWHISSSWRKVYAATHTANSHQTWTYLCMMLTVTESMYSFYIETGAAARVFEEKQAKLNVSAVMTFQFTDSPSRVPRIHLLRKVTDKSSTQRTWQVHLIIPSRVTNW